MTAVVARLVVLAPGAGCEQPAEVVVAQDWDGPSGTGGRMCAMGGSATDRFVAVAGFVHQVVDEALDVSPAQPRRLDGHLVGLGAANGRAASALPCRAVGVVGGGGSAPSRV